MINRNYHQGERIFNLTFSIPPEDYGATNEQLYIENMPNLLRWIQAAASDYNLWAELDGKNMVHFHACYASKDRIKQSHFFKYVTYKHSGFNKLTLVNDNEQDFIRSRDYYKQDSEKKHSIFKHPLFPTVLEESDKITPGVMKDVYVEANTTKTEKRRRRSIVTTLFQDNAPALDNKPPRKRGLTCSLD